jgi:hypothetical protein
VEARKGIINPIQQHGGALIKKINPTSKHCTCALRLVPGLKMGAGMSRGIGVAAELEELGGGEDRTAPALEQLWVITEGEEVVPGEK